MVDIDVGRIIDLFESREAGDIAKWLSTYPNIEVVSRDGSTEYAKAISAAHPNAIQVSDRFHLIKNLTEYAVKHIKKVVGARFRITAEQGNADGGYWDMPERFGPDLLEREHAATTEKRAAVIARVQELAAEGMNISRIAEEIGVCYATVKKYMNQTFSPARDHYGVSKPSKLDPYADTIDAMLRERRKFREIEDAIRQFGYNGAASTIRMYATRQRKRMKVAAEDTVNNTELIQRKMVAKLLYLPVEKVKGITREQLGRILHEYPVINNIYTAVWAFKEILLSKRIHELDAWIENTSSLGIEELAIFCNGLNRDLDAVKNAIRFEYSNGLAEGCVNKLKVIKRIMYGRNSFKLLRYKSLLLEDYRIIN